MRTESLKIVVTAVTIFFCVWLQHGVSLGQVPTFQDCLGATPICLGSYVNGNIITGTGNYPNEINAATSCLLTGERNDAWYIITTGSAGNLSFSVIPNNPLHNYDWALYNLTSATCSDIFNNPSLEVSCNYSNQSGTTGANGLPGAQNNPVIAVTGGQTFLLNVSGFSSIQQNGYTLDFTTSTASIIDNTPPAVSTVTAMNCGATSMSVSFSERVLCSSVSASDFTLTGPGGPYTINSVSSSECASGTSYSRDFMITFSPAIQTAGTYSMNLVGTVTDLCANNAITPQSFQVPISGVGISFQKVDVTCFGGNNGSATAVVTGPPGPYTYQWSPMGGTGATAQFLTAGTYTVTVTSPLGCSATASVTITQPLTGLTATASVTPSNGCAANGTATVTVSNGQPPFTYSWWPTGGNAATATGLTAGGYMVTITDANQCVLNYFLNVPAGTGPSISIGNVNHVSCFGGNDGSATVSVSNATGPFTYNWSPSGGTGATGTGLSAGNYTVDVIIAPGCTLTAGVTIVQPPSPLSVTVSSTQTSCGNNNGSISLNAGGGVIPYSYQWSPAVSTGSSAVSLAGGAYQVTVTDANGCSVINVVTIQSSTQPVPAITNHQNVSCFGLGDGSTGVNVSGGASPISYLWSSGQTSSLLNNISAGSYTVTVTDALGCTATVSDMVIQPPALVITVQSVTNVHCYGDASGSIQLSSTGGNGNNSWTWTGNVSTGQTASGLLSGTYNATVTDQQGCETTQQIVITQPSAPLNLSGSVTPTTCGNHDGSITTSTTGGTAPYTFVWNNGTVASSVNSLNAGIYSVTVTDNNGCTYTSSFQVQASDTPVISVLSNTPVSCYGGNNGAAVLTATGGTTPYIWNWQGGVSASSSASNLPAGTFMVSVTDASGCTSFQQITIQQPAAITVNTDSSFQICIGETAIASAQAAGGTMPYSYQWSNGSQLSQISVSPASTTSYTLTVTDANGCVFNAPPVLVNVHPPLSLSAMFPDSVCTGFNASINLNAGGGDGNYTFTWSNGMTGSSNNISVSGGVNITVTLQDGCTTPQVQTLISIAAINAPAVNFSLPHFEGCEPLDVLFQVPPGMPQGLIYSWNFGDGFTSQQQNPQHTYMSAGTYDVSLTLAYGSAPACSTTLVFPQIVNVFDLPVARFIYDPPHPTLNHPEVYFTDRSSAASNWTWYFGDGTFSQDQNPRHVYGDTGTFHVVLKVQSSAGCRDSSLEIVEVKDEMQVFIPNAFTPDGSGVNDYFKIYGVGFTSYEISIFDRWGKMIHHAVNNDQAWDGKDDDSGTQVPQGMYIYKVTITDNSGNVHHRVNHVTVIR